MSSQSNDTPASTPTSLTLVQNEQNQIVAVKIGEITVPVLTSGIMPGAGVTNFTMTIPDVAISYERRQG